jgi:hypothetical protein
MIDLWRRLHDIFDADDVERPEIWVNQLSDAGMRNLLDYVLSNARELTTDLYTFASESQVYPCSQVEVVDDLVQGELMGMLGLELKFQGIVLPPLGFVTEEPGYMAIVYQMGIHWTPVTLMALFEFFMMILTMDNNATIGINSRYFGKSRQTIFANTLRDYVNEKHVS